ITTLTSAETAGPKASPRIEGILARLSSPDDITRDNASKELLRLKRSDLEMNDSLVLVHAATKAYPKRALGSTAADLIRAAANDLKTKSSRERYEERRHATYALDLMAWLPKADVDASLKEALTADDSLMNYWAAVGLITHGQRVSAKQLDAIASHPELRGYL